MHYTGSIVLLILLLNSFVFELHAQKRKNNESLPKGSLRGTVIDMETGEGLIGATVQLLGTEIGIATDLDGNYVIKDIPAGVYDLECSYLGYITQRVVWIKINEGKASLSYFKLKLGDAKELGVDVVVTAFAARNMEAALLAQRKKAASLLDYISSEEFLRNGDAKLIDGLKRISGVTVENNQKFYLRGLEQRYNNTLLNGYEIPGIESTIASEVLYSIPSAMVDNISIQKNAKADRPANASSGSVNVYTKSFPDKLDLQVNIGTSFNTLATFNPSFLQNDAIKSFGLFEVEVLDGTNVIPEGYYTPQTKDAVEANSAIISEVLKENYEMSAQMPLPTGNLSFYIGNQHKLSKHFILDFQFLMYYNQKYQHYTAGRTGLFRLSAADTMDAILNLEDTKSSKSIDMGVLTSLGLKVGKHSRIKFSLLWNDASSGFAREQIGFNKKTGADRYFRTYTWDFTLRGMIGLYGEGSHRLAKGKYSATMDWHAAYNVFGAYQPDLRYFSYSHRMDQYKNPNDSQFDYVNAYQPTRFIRSPQNGGILGGINCMIPLHYKKEYKKYFKAGISYNVLNRVAVEDRFYYQNHSGAFDGDMAGFVSPSNHVTGEFDTIGTYVYNNKRLRNNYVAYENILAGYILFDGVFSKKFRLNIGVRTEWTRNKISINDNIGINYGVGLVHGIPNLDTTWNAGQDYVLPFVSASMHYQLKENMYLRFAASNTITRPSLREISAFTDFEYIGGYILEGNPNLHYSQCVNLDLRWELFPTNKEIFAVTIFGKYIDQPIEKVAGSDDDDLVINFRNSTFAAVAGIELECKKKLGFMGDWAKDFRVLANFSYIYSVSQLNEETGVRPLFGQAPYVLNTGLSYDNNKLGLQAMILFNLTGQKTVLLMTDGTPNVDELPRPTLDINIVQFLGKKKRWKLQLSIQNLLGTYQQQVQVFGEKTYYHQLHQIGQEFYIGLSYLLR